MRRSTPICIGERIAFSARFLRDTLQQTGAKPLMRGTVQGFAEGAPELAEILWDDGVASHVNVANLVTVQRINAESACAPAIATRIL